MALTALALLLSWPAAAATLMPGGTTNSAAQNWASHNSAGEDAYSALDGINKSNVKTLGLEWSLDLEGEQSLEATPLAVDGVLYFTGSHAAVYAVDAASGKRKTPRAYASVHYEIFIKKTLVFGLFSSPGVSRALECLTLGWP